MRRSTVIYLGCIILYYSFLFAYHEWWGMIGFTCGLIIAHGIEALVKQVRKNQP